MKVPPKSAVQLATLLAGLAFCLFPAPSAQAADPAYNGQALSEWLLLEVKGDPAAGDAIRQIGTNGIPTLIEILGVRERTRSRVLGDIKSAELKEEFSSKDSDLEDLRGLAVDGFGVLGTNAESAAPELAKMFRDNEESFHQTCRALVRVGPKGFSVLTNAMNDLDESVRNNVIWVLGQEGGGDSELITKLLIGELNDPYFANRGNAAKFLAGRDPKLVIPAILPLLDDLKDFYLMQNVVNTLGGYGPLAKAAAPKLLSDYTNALFNRDRKMAFDSGVILLDALGKIDPDSAGKAEPFVPNGGPLGVAGYGWTDTPLPDGKELIAGGFFERFALARAQLFDPATGKRAETGAMTEARFGHVAIFLRSGKVLIAGGEDAQGHLLSSSELYDPASEKWEKTGYMPLQSHGNHAVLRPDGKALIFVEGWDISKGPDGLKYNQELYDPITEKWSVINDK